MTGERRIQEWAEPKSLEDMAAESTGDDRGIRCPRCGCQQLPDARHKVKRTIQEGLHNSVRRRRECRNPSCGHVFTTTETVLGWRPVA